MKRVRIQSRAQLPPENEVAANNAATIQVEMRQVSFINPSVQNLSMDKKIFSVTQPVLRRISPRWYFEFYVIIDGAIRIRKKISAGMNRMQTDEQREQIAHKFLETFTPEKYATFKPAHSFAREKPLHKSIENYIERNRNNWKPKTFLTNLYMARIFSNWCIQMRIAPVKITSHDAARFLYYVLHERNCSTTTYNSYRATLYTMYKCFPVKENPFATVRRYAENKTPQLAFSDEQRRELAEYIAATDPPLFLLIGLVYYTFLRPGEIRQLRVGDIDFTRGLILLPAAASKTNRRRMHRIPNVFIDQLSFLKQYPAGFFVFGEEDTPGGFAGGRDRWARRLRRALDHFGFNHHYSMYSFRHTAAIELYKQYRDIRLVQQAMGHTTVSTTEKYLRNFGVLDDERLLFRHTL